MPALTPEKPVANAHSPPNPIYECMDGYGQLRLPNGTVHRIDKTLPPGQGYTAAVPAEVPQPQGYPHPEESHSSTTFERLRILSHKVILYVENSIVHAKPKPEPAKPYYQAMDGYGQLTLPDGQVFRIEKTPHISDK